MSVERMIGPIGDNQSVVLVRNGWYFRKTARTGRAGKWHRVTFLPYIGRAICGCHRGASWVRPAYGRLELASAVPDGDEVCKFVREGV